jgi:hypothetical protein
VRRNIGVSNPLATLIRLPEYMVAEAIQGGVANYGLQRCEVFFTSVIRDSIHSVLTVERSCRNSEDTAYIPALIG